MPEALARMRNDSVLVAPRRRKSAAKPLPFWARWRQIGAFLPRRPGTYAAAALTAVVLGVTANALVLQREHRPPTPFLSSVDAPPAATTPIAAAPPMASVAPAPAPAPIPSPAPAPEPAVAPDGASLPNLLPPVRPSGLGAAAEPVPARANANGDAIGDLLRGGAPKDNSRLTLAAQNALLKLGYVVKPNGVAGPDTISALRDFEKTHGLPASAEITAKLVKSLTGALNAQAAR